MGSCYSSFNSKNLGFNGANISSEGRFIAVLVFQVADEVEEEWVVVVVVVGHL